MTGNPNQSALKWPFHPFIQPISLFQYSLYRKYESDYGIAAGSTSILFMRGLCCHIGGMLRSPCLKTRTHKCPRDREYSDPGS